MQTDCLYDGISSDDLAGNELPALTLRLVSKEGKVAPLSEDVLYKISELPKSYHHPKPHRYYYLIEHIAGSDENPVLLLKILYWICKCYSSISDFSYTKYQRFLVYRRPILHVHYYLIQLLLALAEVPHYYLDSLLHSEMYFRHLVDLLYKISKFPGSTIVPYHMYIITRRSNCWEF